MIAIGNVRLARFDLIYRVFPFFCYLDAKVVECHKVRNGVFYAFSVS